MKRRQLFILLLILGSLQGLGQHTRPYSSVITSDAVAYRGPFTVYKVRDSFFFEVPDTLMHRDLMVINRVIKGPTVTQSPIGGGLYPGESLGEEQAVHFARAPDSSVNLYEDGSHQQYERGSRIGNAVAAASITPIRDTFRIIALSGNGVVLDATGFMKGHSITLTPGLKMPAGVNRRTHVEYIHAYPLNIEMGIYRESTGGEVSVINTSFIELPVRPLALRLFDQRVGYFASAARYFSDDQQKAEVREFIHRWRLEPKPEDVGRWERGELVEPAKPIIFYIDPHTPRQWVPYLIQGVNDWQKAFEQAGFKHAIMGKVWPYGDSISLEDARYSFISYLPSETANAYGPGVVDPRSGEVIQSHVGWYHNVMSLVHDWYMIQAGATDPRARHMKYDESLMGELIRFVSSHEVGHTLGLRHNFGSSSRTPVERLRDKAWLDVHGHTASIMDYARFDYVAQPEDHIPAHDLWPHIGEYDRWAIQWGYKFSGTDDPVADKKIVSKWATDSLASNPRLWFGSMEGEGGFGPPEDPRCQTEDLGDDDMRSNTYGIKNLKWIMPRLITWCRDKNGLYEDLTTAYSGLFRQYKTYIGHTKIYIGGYERTYRDENTREAVYGPVSKARQQEAIDFLNKQLFQTPAWILDPHTREKVVGADASFSISDLQLTTLKDLLGTAYIGKLTRNEAQFGLAASYPLVDYLAAVHHIIWTELPTGRPIDVYRRNLQKAYISDVGNLLLSSDPGTQESDGWSLMRTDLLRLQKEVEMARLRYSSTSMERTHLESQLMQIKKIFHLLNNNQ